MFVSRPKLRPSSQEPCFKVLFPAEIVLSYGPGVEQAGENRSGSLLPSEE